MRIICALFLLLIVGCQSTPTRESLREYDPDTPTTSGLTVGEVLELDQQRHRQAVEMYHILAGEAETSVVPSISPIRHPTITARYVGKDPEGMLDSIPYIEQYRRSEIEGETITYFSDLSVMTIVLEKLLDGEPYEYQELSSNVPYGYCLDFIEENLGAEDEGFTVVKVTCSQDDLGIQF